MPAPYLDVPLWQSEEEDMQQQAAAWVAAQANKGYLLADDICRALDKPETEWRPEDALIIEEVVSTLRLLRKRMVAENVLKQKDCTDV